MQDLEKGLHFRMDYQKQGRGNMSQQLLGRACFLFFNNFLSFFTYLLIFGYTRSLLLHRLFSSCGEQGLLSGCHDRLVITVASFVAEHRLQDAWTSVVGACRLISCGSQAREHRLSSCGTLAQLLCGMWHLPRSGIESVSPALADRLLTTKPSACFLTQGTCEKDLED